MNKLKSKFAWLFSGHYKMERFGCLFLVVAIGLGISVGSVYYRKKTLEKVQLGAQVMYTRDCEMSLTGNTCHVENVFINTDRTKAFVLLKWNDVSKIVTDASKYQVWLTGSSMSFTPEPLMSHPSCGIYMFGSSGYMGIYMVDVDRFPEQIMYMTVRCSDMATTVRSEMPVYDDPSFRQYDQMAIYFNPGGSAFTPASFLDENRMDIYDIYEATVVNGQEEAIRDELDGLLSRMQGSLKHIDEYSYRVQRDGIILLDKPTQIRTDSIVESDDGTLSLVTDYIVQGGYSFDWRNGSILEGYLDEVVPEKYSPVTFLRVQEQAVSKEPWDVKNLTWYRTDGTMWSEENPYGDATVTQTNNDINNLVQAWNDYFKLKQTYQTSSMAKLLRLELNIRDIITNYTMRTDDDTLVIWY